MISLNGKKFIQSFSVTLAIYERFPSAKFPPVASIYCGSKPHQRFLEVGKLSRAKSRGVPEESTQHPPNYSRIKPKGAKETSCTLVSKVYRL